MKRVWIPVVVAGLTMATGCGTTSSVSSPNPAGTTKGPELPITGNDFVRICADGLGYAGLPAYAKTPGTVHKAVFLKKEDDRWSQEWLTSDEYPAAWVNETGDKPDKVSLVVCTEPRVKAIPAGKVCDMKDRKTNKPLKVTLYNTQYRLRVLDTNTGKALLDQSGVTKVTECPIVTFHTEGDDPTKHYTEADENVFRPLVKPLIAP